MLRETSIAKGKPEDQDIIFLQSEDTVNLWRVTDALRKTNGDFSGTEIEQIEVCDKKADISAEGCLEY